MLLRILWVTVAVWCVVGTERWLCVLLGPLLVLSATQFPPGVNTGQVHVAWVCPPLFLFLSPTLLVDSSFSKFVFVANMILLPGIPYRLSIFHTDFSALAVRSYDPFTPDSSAIRAKNSFFYKSCVGRYWQLLNSPSRIHNFKILTSSFKVF